MYQAVVIGASAGGVRSIQRILSSLKSDFPLPIAIVQHLSPDSSNILANTLSSLTKLTIKEAEDKEPIKPGIIYFAPPNYHFLIEKDRTVSLSVDEKESYSRPSIDVLFESAADAYGPDLIGIVLTGASHDGARGAKTIKDIGGLIIVEEPKTAESSTMPEAARKLANPNYVLPSEKIGPLLDVIICQGDQK